MIKKLYLFILLLLLASLFACAPQQNNVAKPIPMYKDTIVEDDGPC